MKLQLLALATLASYVNAQDVAALTGLYGDISAHASEYLSYVQDGHSLPNGLLSLYQEVQTYTDDSYTTLLSNVDIGQISSFATGLPWYSSRLETIFAEATGGSGGSSGSSGSVESSQASTSSLDSSLVGGSSASSIISSITSSGSAARSSNSAAGGGSGSNSGSDSQSGSQSGSDSSSESSGSGSGSSSSGGSGGSSSSEGGSTGSGAGFAVRDQSAQVVYFLIPFMMVLAAPALL